ncbi:MAG: D-alanyl-D-alanine carboxypeptidase [Lachnospiraceae bacterium]|nr:D-alanyl-D-alanine carboxypeptidase [Lachnospiraceae bacterium]
MKKRLICLALAVSILTYNSISALAVPAQSEEADIIETNEIANWPTGPELNAKAAFLMEANTGVVLYAKNIHEHLYPASTTKMMTALIAAEKCSMDEMVDFSYDAVFSLEAGSSNIGIDPGQAMSMEECLYGLMVASANEVANAIGEHVAGSMDGFVDMMNDKAEEMGLKDTHFTNANGLFNEEHYTSAYDLAIIAKEFFNNEYLAKIGNTGSYHFVQTSTQPDDFYVRNKHKLISGEIPYAGIKGGKTGYTSEAGETLVTCAEQNGMTLICVVLKEESPEQFYDTVKLFDYGFSNFDMINIADNEEKYSIKNNNFFPTTIDILGSSRQLLELDDKDNIIMPRNIGFSDMETELIYNTGNEEDIAYINYSYHGAYLGYGRIKPLENKKELSAFDVENPYEDAEEEISIEEPAPRFINVVRTLSYVVGGVLVLIVISFIHSFFVNYNLLDNLRRKRSPRPKRRREKDKLKF